MIEAPGALPIIHLVALTLHLLATLAPRSPSPSYRLIFAVVLDHVHCDGLLVLPASRVAAEQIVRKVALAAVEASPIARLEANLAHAMALRAPT